METQTTKTKSFTMDFRWVFNNSRFVLLFGCGARKVER